MNETDKIYERYQKQKNIPSAQYSYFDPGNLFIIQQREKKLLELLKKHGYQNLTELQTLDVGCGNGPCLRQFVKYGANPKNLFGAELLAERTQKAQTISPNISITKGNAEHINFSNKAFDIVLQSTVFTSILDYNMKTNIAREMLRVLKDDGIIIWYDFRYNNPNNADVKGIKKEEIKKLFPNCTYDFHKTTLIPPIARMLAKFSWITCYFLSLLPLFLSHYLVIIKKRNTNNV